MNEQDLPHEWDFKLDPDLPPEGSATASFIERLYDPVESEDFEKCNIATGMDLINRTRGLDVSDLDYAPCTVYSSFYAGCPYWGFDVCFGIPDEPIFKLRPAEAVFTGDFRVMYHVPRDWVGNAPAYCDRELKDGTFLVPLRLGEHVNIGSFQCNGKWGFIRADDDSVFLDPVFGYTDVNCENEDVGSDYARFNYGSEHVSMDADFDEDVYPNHKDIADGRWGMINAEEPYIFYLAMKPEYQYISTIINRVIVAKKDGHWGMVNASGYNITDFIWDDMWLDWAYGAIAKKETEYGPRYSILDSDGEVLIDQLPGFPHLLYKNMEGPYGMNTYCCNARYFRDGDKYGVINCYGPRTRTTAEENRVELVSDAVLTFKEAKSLIKKLDRT